MSHADKNCETDLSTTWPLLFTLVRSQSWSLILKKKEITYSQIINCCIASFRQQMLMRVLGEGVLPNSLHVVDDCRILGPFFFHRFFSYHPSNYYFFSHSFQAQVEVAMNVGAYHYDTLFDYYDELSDPEARKRVRFYYYYFQYAISPMLKFRNYRRFRKGHLTYPYLQYPWLPNGIQT